MWNDLPVELFQLFTVSAETNKLVLRSGGGNRYLHFPLTVLHRDAQEATVLYVLFNPEMGSSAVRVSDVDEASLAVLDRLPKGRNEEVVQRVLLGGAAKAGGASARAGAVLDLPEVTGWIEFDGRVVSIIMGAERKHYLLGVDDMPTVIAKADLEDGSITVQLTLPGVGQRRLRVPSQLVIGTEKSLLFFRGTTSKGDDSARIRWEYRIVKNMMASSLEAQLNQLGGDGWEVVSIAGLDGVLTLTGNKLFAVLKRPRARR